MNNNNIVQFVLLICILDLAKLCMHDDEVKSIACFKSACPVRVVSYAKGIITILQFTKKIVKVVNL